jgi:hypothetical protein
VQGCRSRRAMFYQILTDHFTLSWSGREQIMPTLLLVNAPLDFQTFLWHCCVCIAYVVELQPPACNRIIAEKKSP